MEFVRAVGAIPFVVEKPRFGWLRLGVSAVVFIGLFAAEDCLRKKGLEESLSALGGLL